VLPGGREGIIMLLQGLQYAVRSIKKSPGQAAAVIAMLAFGIARRLPFHSGRGGIAAAPFSLDLKGRGRQPVLDGWAAPECPGHSGYGSPGLDTRMK
jgi:hypothetical protein